MKTYKQKKQEAREEAIEWQTNFDNHNYSLYELALYGSHFDYLAKRYGLIKEFKANGII